MAKINLNPAELNQQLQYLNLIFIRENYESLAKQAAQKQWTHIQFLTELIQAETQARSDRSVKRRITQAHFPQIKTLEQFKWSWPKKINRPQVQNMFRLKFIEDKSNIIFVGGVGLGKTHLATALGYQACLQGYAVLFVTAVDAINNLNAAKSTGRPKPADHRIIKPGIVVIKIGFVIQFLVREFVAAHVLAGMIAGGAEGFVLGGFDHGAVVVGHDRGRAQMVFVIIKGVIALDHDQAQVTGKKVFQGFVVLDLIMVTHIINRGPARSGLFDPVPIAVIGKIGRNPALLSPDLGRHIIGVINNLALGDRRIGKIRSLGHVAVGETRKS